MTRSKFFLLFLLTGLICSTTFAQNDSVRVMQVINRLLFGMKTGNPELVSSAFDSAAVLMSIGKAEGRTSVHNQSADQFLKAIAAPHKQIWDERIFNPVIKMNDDLAFVWAEYSFYLGDQLNHCGIDSFQLVKRNGGWKILVIVDTRKKEGCEK